MLLRLIPLIVMNARRSRVRSLTTLAGCMVGAFIIAFALSIGGSVDRLMTLSSDDANLVVTQRDRY
jgi:hypothetical protein